MAEFLDARKQAHHQPQQQQSHQTSSNDKKDLFKTVPDVVEERKKDQDGIYHVVNKYVKGNILGKVRTFTNCHFLLIAYLLHFHREVLLKYT